MNDFSDEKERNKHHKKRKFHNEAEEDEDDDSLRTTDSDHQELLRIIKKRKLVKLKAGQKLIQSSTLSVKHKKHNESPTIVSNEGSTLQSKIPSHYKAPDEDDIRQLLRVCGPT